MSSFLINDSLENLAFASLKANALVALM